MTVKFCFTFGASVNFKIIPGFRYHIQITALGAGDIGRHFPGRERAFGEKAAPIKKPSCFCRALNNLAPTAFHWALGADGIGLCKFAFGKCWAGQKTAKAPDLYGQFRTTVITSPIVAMNMNIDGFAVLARFGIVFTEQKGARFSFLVHHAAMAHGTFLSRFLYFCKRQIFVGCWAGRILKK